MLSLTRIFTMTLLVTGSSAIAGTMGPTCAPGNLSVPCANNGWEFGAEALYLQPIYSVEGNSPRAIFSPNYSSGDIPLPSANWAWGFMIEGAYHWGTGKDISLSWYHVNHATELNVIFPFIDMGAPHHNFQAPETLNLHPQWDAANVEFGRHIDIDEQESLRVHAGVQYARVITHLTGFVPGGTYTDINGNVTAGPLPTQHQNVTSKYNGFGPRGGIDLNYDLSHGVSIYANGAGALLIGSASFINERLESAPLGGSSDPGTNAAYGSRTIVIPELEAKLGVKYHHQLQPVGKISQSDLTLDVGWMWVNYFNAQMYGTNEAGNIPGQSPTIYPERINMSQTNFALQGLYFGAKWLGNV